MEDNIDNTFYEKNKWKKLFKYNNKNCFWRITKDNYIEYALGKYSNEKDALIDGKVLYFNILYNMHMSRENFDYGDEEYVTNFFHENANYTYEEYINEEKWFINSKDRFSNFCGLGIYELDESIDDFDNFYVNVGIEWKQCFHIGYKMVRTYIYSEVTSASFYIICRDIGCFKTNLYHHAAID